jgi:hypothetical protein
MIAKVLLDLNGWKRVEEVCIYHGRTEITIHPPLSTIYSIKNEKMHPTPPVTVTFEYTGERNKNGLQIFKYVHN